MKLISEKELREFLIASKRLRRLDAFGVDNWGWYSKALNKDGNLENWEEIDLKEYPDYNVTSFENNYNFD